MYIVVTGNRSKRNGEIVLRGSVIRNFGEEIDPSSGTPVPVRPSQQLEIGREESEAIVRFENRFSHLVKFSDQTTLKREKNS